MKYLIRELTKLPLRSSYMKQVYDVTSLGVKRVFLTNGSLYSAVSVLQIHQFSS